MKADDSRPAHILVLYHSQNGHTKMMADLVAEGAASVPATEVRLKSVVEATGDDLMWCDGWRWVRRHTWEPLPGK